jgi:hypothetical protein
MKSLLLTMLALSLSLSAADFTGKWAGTYSIVTSDGDTQTGNVTLILTQTGSDLTGTVGTDTGEVMKIANGHVEGDVVTFESHTDGPVMKVTLQLDNDHLKGLAKGQDEGGDKLEAKVDLMRKVDQ